MAVRPQRIPFAASASHGTRFPRLICQPWSPSGIQSRHTAESCFPRQEEELDLPHPAEKDIPMDSLVWETKANYIRNKWSSLSVVLNRR